MLLPTREGTVPFTYEGEAYHTYYKVFGELSTRTHTPLVVLHGGPGLTHDYVLPHATLAARGIPVVFYDQLGNGRSTHLPDKPHSFWTIALFAAELASLLAALGIADAFDLLGQSWGGMLASEVAVRQAQPGLRRLVLSDSLPSIALWDEACAKLFATFPQDIQDGIAVGMADKERHYAGMMAFYAKFCVTTDPMPEVFVYSVREQFKDSAVAEADSTMLKDWTIIDRLHLISVPTLIMNGASGPTADWVTAPLFWKIPRAKWVSFSKSTHMPYEEEPQEYFETLHEFLTL